MNIKNWPEYNPKNIHQYYAQNIPQHNHINTQELSIQIIPKKIFKWLLNYPQNDLLNIHLNDIQKTLKMTHKCTYIYTTSIYKFHKTKHMAKIKWDVEQLHVWNLQVLQL